ncbi:S-adenosylmethionine:tRNA ribosyltransferase-isomerase [Metabacillus sp. FJAT-52054]|uniref:S-adenosylmethionine:tRNA ribosyltransferase-isomerase n=1 Tax=Metabacillus sediminis TaxID=3117746 RepID=A0ABZ2NM59_9BACI
MTIQHQAFHIPDSLHAAEPAEQRTGRRDAVRLLVLEAESGMRRHSSFREIGSFLKPGDLLVFNNSRTIPAVLKGTFRKGEVEVRLSRKVSDHIWEAIIYDGLANIGDTITFNDRLEAVIYGRGIERPLILLKFSKSGVELLQEIYLIGKAVDYEYIQHPWPLESYQTVYASVPGSVEMPSAGRAFTWKLLQQLKSQGVQIAFLQLHAGLSYFGGDIWPDPAKHFESYRVPEETAKAVLDTKLTGGRVIAVGTTVVRALETAAENGGLPNGTEGVTNLYVTRNFARKAVDGLLTGFHEPEASHLDMLSAFIKPNLLGEAYKEALMKNYLWHEFGDMNLILP